MDGSTTEYVCAYGNNGSYRKREREICSNLEYQNTMHVSQPTVAGAIGTYLEWER